MNEPTSIELLDGTGKRIQQQVITIREGLSQWNMQLLKLVKGLYYLRMTSNGERKTKPVLIE